MPLTPNGVIVLYNVFRADLDGDGEMLVATSATAESAVVDELQPFTQYFFTVEACTAQGCNRSQPTSGFTQEGGK